MRDTDVYIEITTVGGAVKVTAIDGVTGEEVSMVGDPNATNEQLQRLALQKLRYVQAKRKFN